MSDRYYALGLVLGVTISLLAVGLFYAFRRQRKDKERDGSDDYDERQKLLRGRAFQHAFFTVLIGGALYAMLVLALGRPLMEDGVSTLLLAFLGILVFGVECILRDAFFAMRKQPKTFLLLFGCTTVAQLGAISDVVAMGGPVHNGVLTFQILPFISAVTFLSLFIMIAVKTAAQKPEDED